MTAVNIKLIRTDGGTQSRLEIDQTTVDDYARQIEEGAKFPPVTVFNDGIDTYLADGFHRYFAHLKADKASIDADVRQGTLRDAVLFSLAANALHGKQRTNADKRKVIMTMLDDFEWSEWADREIARHCHVDPKTVGAARNGEQPKTRKEIRNGKVRERQYKAPEPAIEEILAEPKFDDETQLQVEELLSMNNELEEKLALALMPDADKDGEAVSTLIQELREENKMLALELKSVTMSRDQFQQENSELKKQLASQTKQLRKLLA